MILADKASKPGGINGLTLRRIKLPPLSQTCHPERSQTIRVRIVFAESKDLCTCFKRHCFTFSIESLSLSSGLPEASGEARSAEILRLRGFIRKRMNSLRSG